MRVTFDPEAEALYIYIIEGDYERHNKELVQDTVFLDKTKLGQIAGIEILGVNKIEEIK